jgi:hypothetical protein
VRFWKNKAKATEIAAKLRRKKKVFMIFRTVIIILAEGHAPLMAKFYCRGKLMSRVKNVVVDGGVRSRWISLAGPEK